MKTAKHFVFLSLFIFCANALVVAQSGNLSEIFKQHLNETNQQVKATDDADEKRAILNESFSKLLLTINRIDSTANLSDDERSLLLSFKEELQDKKSELNGEDGYDEVLDEDLDDFSDYSQQAMEQARRYITISVTTALLILIILLLL